MTLVVIVLLVSLERVVTLVSHVVQCGHTVEQTCSVAFFHLCECDEFIETIFLC